ncbi:N-acetylmuramoyl-L-alanine amidase family protein [Sporomusa sphaeroides]|uniref:N-acetylmuramoyl-L-alanine amidase LytC n=1 Tax=Sporomusa sphaeroides DSM 2875 TaxID=1337886 RepID=A0ABP2C1W4_9FIRM|nr:N-acetylmuramoyl-L-alanine amidase [Sporomusa sphaeroides]OLS56352.1 N-acetylmuramoyl-L-alanine amidase LytC precursor [Sporomusa sphaeroides DSM 2875]CVK18447.1 N-acetylmuramoyl-L-alanine amidase LytC precursor [Sporomusa sphaeroides DSM 2875]
MAKSVIDPGHAGGRTDPGACNPITGLQEADVNLAVSKLVTHYLDAAGCLVRMTRTEREQPETDSLQFRCDVANAWGADLFVSLHCNSATNPAAKGFEIYTTKGNTGADRLATCITNQVAVTFPDLPIRADWSDGDVDKEENFYVLRYTNAPAVLVEMAFISNPEEAALLANPTWRDRMARAIARGVTDYLSQ